MEAILKRLQQSFAIWHSTSSKKRYSNADLREEAVKCLSHYTFREVSIAAGVSVNTLRTWKKSITRNDQGTVNASPEFIAINLGPTQNIDQSRQETLVLQVTLVNGILIKIDSTSIASSVSFISALNKEANACSI